MTQRYPFPDQLHYERTQHMWARLEEDGTVLVGIDVLGLENLGDLAYVTLFATGTTVQRGGAVGTLEAAKMTGDIQCPVSGEVVARNDGAIEDPGLVNREPYDGGWLVRIAPSDWQADAAQLLHGSDVSTWAAAEIARFQAEGWIE